jgi:hypothetical protein
MQEVSMRPDSQPRRSRWRASRIASSVLVILATSVTGNMFFTGGAPAAPASPAHSRATATAAFVTAKKPARSDLGTPLLEVPPTVEPPTVDRRHTVDPPPSVIAKTTRDTSGVKRVGPSAVPHLIFGLGPEADSAIKAPLTTQSPISLLSSWYNGPGDLTWITRWRNGTVPRAYAAGYALHLIVWTNDPEAALSTSYGPACGRGYPLSARFPDDMKQLAQTFAGPADGPPLYVTLFSEFETFPCKDSAWSPDAETTNYYRALRDRYVMAYQIFHQYAPNASVSLGWGGWQASFDSPAIGGGRSLFAHFDDLLRMSDFQSFQAMESDGNVEQIKAMVAILGRYGPVMLAHYKPDKGNQAVFDADVHTILTDSFLTVEHAAGLFAMSFMDSQYLAPVSTFDFVKSAVVRYTAAC